MGKGQWLRGAPLVALVVMSAGAGLSVSPGVARADTTSPSASAAELTEAEIEARATRFLGAVGAADAGAAPVSIAVDPERSDALRLSFKSDTFMSVQRETGKIVRFFDPKGPVDEETGKRLSKEELKAAAARYLEAAGITLEDAVFKNNIGFAAVINNYEPPIVMIVSWERVYKGYRVGDDSINVEVDGQSGALVALGESFISKMPADMTPRITLEQAMESARAYSKREMTGKGQLVICCTPGSFGAKDQLGRQTRLIWYVAGEGGISVSVDAITGEALEMAVPSGVDWTSRSSPDDKRRRGASSLASAYDSVLAACAIAAVVVLSWFLVRSGYRRLHRHS